MDSKFLDPYQPFTQAQQLKYEISHHQNCGQDQVLITQAGVFPTLQDAQDAAQGVLSSMLEHYISRGWIGYYCNEIDLKSRGLIAGLVSPQVFEPLSEIQIHVVEKVHEPAQAPGTSELWMQTARWNPTNTTTGYSSNYGKTNPLVETERLTPYSPNTFIHSHKDINSYDRGLYLTRRTDSFSQTRSLYPGYSTSFIPRSFAQYNQIMSFPTPRDNTSTSGPTARSNSRRQSKSNQHRTHHQTDNKRQRDLKVDQFIGNPLGGGYDIGEPYVGRRHSSIDLPSENKPFQYTVEEC